MRSTFPFEAGSTSGAGESFATDATVLRRPTRRARSAAGNESATARPLASSEPFRLRVESGIRTRTRTTMEVWMARRGIRFPSG